MYCPGEFVNDEQSPRGHGQESVFSWPWTIGVSYMPVGTPPTDHDENLGRAAFRDRFDLVHVGALLGIQFALPGASAGPLFGDASRLSQGGLDLRAAPSDRPGRLRRLATTYLTNYAGSGATEVAASRIADPHEERAS